MNNSYILSFLLLYIYHTTSKILTKHDYTLYFDQYNFNWNNAKHWHITTPLNPTFTACIIPIKSLNQNICIKTKSKGGLTLSLNNNTHSIQLDFLNNTNWNNINTIYNWNINKNTPPHRRLYNTYTYRQYLRTLPFKMSGLLGWDTGKRAPDWRKWYYSNRDKLRYKGNHFGGRGGFGGRGRIFKKDNSRMDPIATDALRLAIMDHITRTRGGNAGAAQMAVSRKYMPIMMRIMNYAAMAMDNNYNDEYGDYYYDNVFYKGRRLVMKNQDAQKDITSDDLTMECLMCLDKPGSVSDKVVEDMVAMNIKIEKCRILDNGLEICVIYSLMTSQLDVNVKYQTYKRLANSKHKRVYSKTVSKMIQMSIHQQLMMEGFMGYQKWKAKLMNGHSVSNDGYVYYFDTFEFNWNKYNNWDNIDAINVLPLIQFGDEKVLLIEVGEKCVNKWSFLKFTLCASVNNTDIVVFFKEIDVDGEVDVFDISEMDESLIDIINYEFERCSFSFSNDDDWNEIITLYPILYDTSEQTEAVIELFGRSYGLKEDDILNLGQPIKLTKNAQLPVTKMCSFMYVGEVCIELNPNGIELKLSMRFYSQKWNNIDKHMYT